ncbi:hypothetical protein D3C85_1431730 [compost metagenome]
MLYHAADQKLQLLSLVEGKYFQRSHLGGLGEGQPLDRQLAPFVGEQHALLLQGQQILLQPDRQLFFRQRLAGELEQLAQLVQGPAFAETEDA